jgi:hypothetical protein
MWEALIVLSTGFLMGGAVVWFLGSVILWRFSRRCTQLEYALGDIQARLTSFKGKEMSEKRWQKERAFDAEMAQVLQSGNQVTRKYDNDPLG